MSGAPSPDAANAVSWDAASVVSCDADGYRYVFHVPTGDEALFHLASDPRMLCNLLPSEPDRAERMRRNLETQLGVPTLEVLRNRYADTISRLRSLGYL